MKTCLTCKGDKEYRTIDTLFRVQKCPDCNGAGEIDDARYYRIQQGAELRRARMERDESMREMAKRIGVNPATLSDMEAGRTEPDFTLYK